MGKEKRRRELIRDLDSIYEEIVRMFCVSQGDFPEVDQFRHGDVSELVLSFALENSQTKGQVKFDELQLRDVVV